MLPRSLRYAGRARKNCAQEKAACSGRDDTAGSCGGYGMAEAVP